MDCAVPAVQENSAVPMGNAKQVDVKHNVTANNVAPTGVVANVALVDPIKRVRPPVIAKMRDAYPNARANSVARTVAVANVVHAQGARRVMRRGCVRPAGVCRNVPVNNVARTDVVGNAVRVAPTRPVMRRVSAKPPGVCRNVRANNVVPMAAAARVVNARQDWRVLHREPVTEAMSAPGIVVPRRNWPAVVMRVARRVFVVSIRFVVTPSGTKFVFRKRHRTAAEFAIVQRVGIPVAVVFAVRPVTDRDVT